MKQFVKYNFKPLTALLIALLGFGYMTIASTITTINTTDLISDSRATINTNFSNLNTDKLEGVAVNFVDVTYTLIGATTYYTASSTASSNLAWRFNNGFVSNASSTLVSGFTATASSTVSGNLNAGGLIISDLTSALTLTNSTGVFAEYAGASCTSQFVRSLSALGAATCATVVAGDVDLADLTATDGTLTFSGTYDGQTARTIGLNLASSNEWTASTTISAILNVEALLLTASGTISILNTNILNVGSSTIQTLNINSCNGCNREIEPLFSFALGSTSPRFQSGSFVPLPTKPFAYTITDIFCYTTSGTSKVINVSDDGTNDTESITCDADGAEDDGSIVNGSATANELMRVEIGAGVGAVDYVTITISGRSDR